MLDGVTGREIPLVRDLYRCIPDQPRKVEESTSARIIIVHGLQPSSAGEDLG